MIVSEQYISKPVEYFSASTDLTAKLWSTEDMAEMNTMSEGISSPIISMALSSNNTFVAIGMGSLHVL